MPLVSAVKVWSSVGVPLMVGTPVGASLTLATGASLRAGQRPFGGAVAVGVGHLHADLRAHIGIAQGVGAGRGAADGRTPLRSHW